MNAVCKLTWLGHAAGLVEIGGARIVLDPYLNDSPTAPLRADQLEVDYVLVSHGHADHVGDSAAIANRCGATLISNYEITEWFRSKHNVRNVIGMNLGGGVTLPFGEVKLTIAFHSSQLPDGAYAGNPGGFLISSAGKRLYFACDTALFGDMRLLTGSGLDLAVLPIGDLFTMGIDDSLEAIRLLKPKQVAPSHYNTWPPIAQDVQRWAERVRQETEARPVVTVPGQPFLLDS